MRNPLRHIGLLWRHDAPAGTPSTGLRRAFLLLRAGSLLLLTAAILGLTPLSEPGELHTLLLLDRSASIADPAAAEAMTAELTAASATAGPVSLVLFDDEAYTLWERRIRPGEAALPPGAGTASRIDLALERALGLLDPGEEARIVLLSDGRQTAGEALDRAALAGQAGVPVHTLLLPARGTESASLLGLSLPPRAAAGETVRCTATYAAAEPLEAEITLLLDGATLGRERRTLEPGGGTLAYEVRIDAGGLHTIEIELALPGSGRRPGIDRAAGTIYVTGPAPILLVSDSPSASAPLASALRAQGYSVDAGGAELLAEGGTRLYSYSALILDGVPAFDLSLATMEEIERYVLEYGGGLLMLGGEGSFGSGGYYQTPVERVLPVEMDPAASLFVPTLTMLMLLDTSGSMAGRNEAGETKLSILKEAVLAASSLLNPSFEVAVIGFDASYSWALPFTPAGETEEIRKRLGEMRAGGGTLLYPALEEAYRGLLTSSSAVKHLIILSDGLVQPGPFEDLTTRMQADGITVSTVAVGTDSDRGLLEQIAGWGGGRSYYTDSIGSAPRIFASESMIVSRTVLRDETFFPFLQTEHPVLDGVAENGIPPLFGFQAVYPRPAATVPLLAVEESPLLALMRPGLGRSAAFTSGLDGAWGREWIHWEMFPRFAGQLTGWLARPGETEGNRLQLTSDGAEVRAVLSSTDPRSGPRLLESPFLMVAEPGAAPRRFELEPRAPGVYDAVLPVDGRGILFASAYAETFLTAAGIALPVASELRPGSADGTLMAELSRASGGESFTNPRDLGIRLPGERQPREIPLVYLIPALLLLLVDVALRLWPGRVPGGEDLAELDRRVAAIRGTAPRRDPRFWFGG